jgi:hypothetical protein
MKPNRESAEPGADTLLDSLVQPLRDLQRQYVRARALVAEIESALGVVVGRVAREPHLPPFTGPAPVPGEERPPMARLQVRVPGQGALLLFEQRLSALEGVASVTVAGSTPTDCTLLVELLNGGGGEPDVPAPAPTIVCTNCGRVLFEGSSEISHGLCPDCLREFGSGR